MTLFLVPLPQLTLQSAKLVHAVYGLITDVIWDDDRGTSNSTESDNKPKKEY